mgnify:CR=1 FL=1|jgi:hypothetical protein
MAIKFVNVGQTDRAIRALAGIGVMILPFVSVIELSSLYGKIAIGVGVVLIATGVFKFCPAYSLLSVNTQVKQ